MASLLAAEELERAEVAVLDGDVSFSQQAVQRRSHS
jgi:hypothetical protein